MLKFVIQCDKLKKKKTVYPDPTIKHLARSSG